MWLYSQNPSSFTNEGKPGESEQNVSHVAEVHVPVITLNVFY